MANLFVQAEAQTFGKTAEEPTAEGWLVIPTPFRVTEGNRPSNTILADDLARFSLRAQVAPYEHHVFTRGVIWGFDSIDQWGVELGKVLAQRIILGLETAAESKPVHDSSTNGLIRCFRPRRHCCDGCATQVSTGRGNK